MSPFRKSHAVVIGIDAYRHGIPRLTNAGRDAREVARVLEEGHGYEVTPLTEGVSRDRLLKLLREELPGRVGPDDRLLFYFAGHGVAKDSEKGLSGFLLPEDARPGSGHRHTLLDMDLLKEGLTALPCHHLLVVLDCCFAGAFRWSMTRDTRLMPKVVHQELYRRYIADPAWQVITSAAHDQLAHDALQVLGEREEDRGHSPFARALFEGLQGAADLVPRGGDGLITTGELVLYLRDQVERRTQARGLRQTPGMWSLKEQDKGEYVFEVPGRPMTLPPAPTLDQEANPYRGLEPFQEKHEELFFGRERVLERLLEHAEARPFTVLVGPSGTGKSSLVQAGLLPSLRRDHDPPWTIPDPLRPGENPLRSLEESLGESAPKSGDPPARNGGLGRQGEAWLREIAESFAQDQKLRLLLFIDQFEELVTRCPDEEEARAFQHILAEALAGHPQRLRLVVTVRSDFESSFRGGPLASLWPSGRFVVPPMTHDELRRAIVGPASRRVLFLEPDLVEELIEEVLRTPGALPLLSFTLSELYRSYLASGRTDRTLTRREYEALDGVSGAVSRRAEEEYGKLGEESGPPAQASLQRVMLRMVELGSGEPTRRRMPRRELTFASDAENRRVRQVLESLLTARLIVAGRNAQGEVFLEPAHDRLITAWERLRRWISAEREAQPLLRRLTRASEEWVRGGERSALLWDRQPNVGKIQDLRDRQPEVLNRGEDRFVLRSLGKHRQSRRLRILGLVAAVVLPIVAAVVFFVQRDQARSQRDLSRAQSLAARAVTVQEESKQDENASLIALRAYQLNIESGQPLMTEVDNALRTILREPFYSYIFLDRPHTIRGLAFSPDGRHLAAAGERTRLRIWPVADPGERPRDLAPYPKLLDIAFVDDGAAALTAGVDLQLWFLSSATDIAPLRLDREDGISMDLAVSPTAPLYAAIQQTGTVQVWDLRQPERPRRMHLLDAQIRPFVLYQDEMYGLHLTWDGEGRRLFHTDFDGQVLVWDLSVVDPTHSVFTRHEGPVFGLAVSPNNRWLASAGGDGLLLLSPLQGGENLKIWAEGENRGWRAVAFSPDSEQLAAAGDDDHLYLWSMAAVQQGDFRPLVVLDGHNRGITILAYGPDGRMLASGGPGGMIRLWDLEATEPIGWDLPEQPVEVHQLSLCERERWLASSLEDGTIQVWNVETGELLDEQPRAHGRDTLGLAFGPDCRLLASGGDDRMLRLWSLEGRRLSLLGAVRDETCRALNALAFSPDGLHVAVACEAGTVKLWDVHQPRSPALLFEAVAHNRVQGDELIRGITFRPDGKILASGSGDGVIKLWDLADPTAAPTVLRHTTGPAAPGDRIYSLAYSHDGNILAVGYFGGAIRLWRQDSPQPLLLPGHESRVLSLAFTPDGKRLLSAGGDNDLRIWDLEEPRNPPLVLNHHQDEVRSVVVEAGGKHFISAGEDGRIVRSLLSTEDLAAKVCAKVRHDISRQEWRLFVGDWGDSFYQRICSDRPLQDIASPWNPAMQ